MEPDDATPFQGLDLIGRLNRSFPPRKARSRSTKRLSPSAIGARATFVTRHLRPLEAAQLRRISEVLTSAPLKSARLRAGIQDIASVYLRQRQQPEPLKSEARHDLAMIAHKVWLLDRDISGGDAAKAELRYMVGRLSGLAQSALWGGLDRHPAYDGSMFLDYLRREDLDWSVVGDAAEVACALLLGGDYPNIPAVIAMQDLASLYVDVTRKRVTFSRKPVGPAGKTGRQREIGNSPFFKFVMAFFSEVDPAVTPLWITGRCSARRQTRSNTRI